jgi:hypothetical protein
LEQKATLFDSNKTIFTGGFAIHPKQLLPLIVLLIFGASACAPVSAHPEALAAAPPTPRPTATADAPVITPILNLPTAAPPTATRTPAPPTPTATRVVNYTATAPATRPSTTAVEVLSRLQKTAAPPLRTPAPLPPASLLPLTTAPRPPGERLVLAHYFAWFDDDGWHDCNISAGDTPLEPYESDDPATIARHIHMASDIGLNGFLLHWFAPGDRTDRNFATLLRQSEGNGFTSSVVFSRHIWPGSPGPSRQSIGEALRYIIDSYGAHPNFLRSDGRPVIFFTDVYRTPSGNAPQFWASVRQAVDPHRQTLWIAEGLDPSYLAVFDGLYVFKVTHAAYPHDYLKSPRWGSGVRDWEAKTGEQKLWLATITPGWDDLRAGCRPDVRVDNVSHRLDRADGETYRASFEAALASQPDWLVVGSFNEWVEGTYIEPGVQYGDKYMRMTKDFIRQFRGQRSPAP